MRLTHCIFMMMALLVVGCVSPKSFPPPRQGTGEWRTHTFARIGLAIDLPDWNADIDDQETIWTLFAFPLVANPVADAQYGMVIGINKTTILNHQQSYLKNDNPSDLQSWMNSQHLPASQNGNLYWLYSRRDILGTNGNAYYCLGKVKRVGEAWEFDKMDRVGGDYRKLGLEMHRIFQSIRVLPAAAATPSAPK